MIKIYVICHQFFLYFFINFTAQQLHIPTASIIGLPKASTPTPAQTPPPNARTPTPTGARRSSGAEQASSASQQQQQQVQQQNIANFLQGEGKTLYLLHGNIF